MLSLTWYIEPPIDFEYKNYILLDYIQRVDNSFKEHNLSPYLLHTEKVFNEMITFSLNQNSFLRQIEKDSIQVVDNRLMTITSKFNDGNILKTINEIVEYSTPILESKVKLGYILLNKYPQIIW